MLNSLWLDLRYTLRSLGKHALLSIVVVVTLTIGIGISTGVFTYISAEALRPRVDKDHESVVVVFSSYARGEARRSPPGETTLEDYFGFRDGTKSLRELAAYGGLRAPLGKDDPEEVRTLLVTPNFFTVYGLEKPMMGRLLQQEDASASSPVVVISERLWRNRLEADPEIVGKTVHFNGQPVTVVGVAPTFSGMINGARAWFPYTLEKYLNRSEASRERDEAWLNVEGRLKPGFSHEEAADELKVIATQQDRLYPGRTTTLTVTDGSGVQHPEFRALAIGLFSLITGAITFLVLIVSINVTTLLLARATARQGEIGVRLALGASKMRVIRLLLMETFLFASIAGLASVYYAYNLPEVIERWLIVSDDLHEPWSLAPDWRSFVYLTLITIFAATVAGLTPALQSLKVNLSDAAKGRQSQMGGAVRSSRLFGWLLGAQVALSFVLLVSAGIFLRTYRAMSTTDFGYETRHVLSVQLRPRRQSTRAPSSPTFRGTLAARIESLPGVQSVAYASRPPFNNGWNSSDLVRIPGGGLRPVHVNSVSPNFFSTLEIPILSGRVWEGSPPCRGASGSVCFAVVSRRLAREFWPNDDPLGKTLQDRRGGTFEVVGVARDVSTFRLGGLDEPVMYLPLDPNAGPTAYQPLVRFSGEGGAVSRAVTISMSDVAPELSVRAQTIQANIDYLIEDFAKMRSLIVLLVAVAASLAIMGIYGVVSFVVTRRTKEWGIRIALGAQKKDIYRAVIRLSVRPVAVGIAIGVVLSIAAATLLAQLQRLWPQEWTMDVHDPTTYGLAVVLLAAASFAAMLGPIRRATRVDPVRVLRSE